VPEGQKWSRSKGTTREEAKGTEASPLTKFKIRKKINIGYFSLFVAK